MEYICKQKGSKSWIAEIILIEQNETQLEADVRGRGTQFHVIVGRHQYGTYLCIPNHGIGCELASLSDTFWNWEQLCRHLSEVDAHTVSTGLYQLKAIW